MWIVKDSCWFFALHYPEHEVPLSIVSFVFAVPTILISFYLVAKSESRFLLAENLLITLWLCANTGWMASELFAVADGFVTLRKPTDSYGQTQLP